MLLTGDDGKPHIDNLMTEKYLTTNPKTKVFGYIHTYHTGKVSCKAVGVSHVMMYQERHGHDVSDKRGRQCRAQAGGHPLQFITTR